MIQEPYVFVCRTCDHQVQRCECDDKPTQVEQVIPVQCVKADEIKVPLNIAFGRYEKLTDEEFRDHVHDLLHERNRREDAFDAFDRLATDVA